MKVRRVLSTSVIVLLCICSIVAPVMSVAKQVFADIDPSDYYYDAVTWAVDRNITKGTTETTFTPNDPCTRGQAVTFLWRANGSEKVTGVRNPFNDVKDADYYYDAVLWAYSNHVTSGMTEKSFGPSEICNRAQIVTFLWRAAGMPDSSSKVQFGDVSKDAYYYEAVRWAVEKGITKGTSSTTFSPGDPCTRGQIVTFLYRAWENGPSDNGDANQEKQFTVSFDANGGSVEVDGIKVIPGNYYGNLPIPTREGYIFEGWFTEEKDGLQVYFNSKVEITGDQTLYAHWTAISYTVYFSPDGGNVDVSRKSILYGETYGELPVPTRAGYIFEGWFTEPIGWWNTSGNAGVQILSTSKVNDFISVCSREQTLYAHWSPDSYVVTFEPNGGEIDITNLKVTYTKTYGELPTPTLKGYTFEGWYTKQNGGAQVDKDTVVSIADNHILYAHWHASSLLVTLDATGGTVYSGERRVTYGETYEYLPTPECKGKTFEGWYTERSGGVQIKDTSIVSITDDHTLYAHWSLIETIKDSWEQIIASINDGTYREKYKIGDTKALDLGTEGIVEMQIADFNVDELADGSGTAAITWIAKQTLNSNHRLNPECEVNPDDFSKFKLGTGTVGGWAHSEMRSWLKSDIKPLFPSVVKDAIKPVIKYSASKDISLNEIQNELTIDDVWIPSLREVAGGAETEGPSYLRLFASDSYRVKNDNWWLRSTATGKEFFHYVATTGYTGFYYYSKESRGVVIGFCM